MINYLRTHPTQLRLVTPKAHKRKQTWSTSPSSSWIDQAYAGLIDDTRLYLAYWKLLMRVLLITYSASKAHTFYQFALGEIQVYLYYLCPGLCCYISQWRKKVKYPHAHYFRSISSNLCLFNYIFGSYFRLMQYVDVDSQSQSHPILEHQNTVLSQFALYYPFFDVKFNIEFQNTY